MNKGSFVKSLFLTHGTELRRFVAKKFGAPHDAEDIIQDAFHNLLRTESPETLENPRAYLYQTAHNLALNRIRKQGHHENYLSLDHESEESRCPERTVSAYKDLESVQKTLEKLPEKCRKAFILSRVHSKTYQEIAEELQVSVSSVEKYLIRSINYLRESFEDID